MQLPDLNHSNSKLRNNGARRSINSRRNIDINQNYENPHDSQRIRQLNGVTENMYFKQQPNSNSNQNHIHFHTKNGKLFSLTL